MSDQGERAPQPDQSDAAPPARSRLFLVRHGQSTWNHSQRIQGQEDPPLSERGLAQAADMAGRLGRARFTAFYASDLQRCRQTAAPLAERLGIEPVLRADLREVMLGDWEGLTAAEIAAKYPEKWARWSREPSWDIVPNSEGSRPFEQRVSAAIDSIFAAHPEGDVVLVTHGGVIQVVLQTVVGRHSSNGLFAFRIQNCSLSKIERGTRGRVITLVNDTSHLR